LQQAKADVLSRNHGGSMNESPQEWILKRRHEDLGVTVRMCWDLYIKFYTVFLTFSVVGLGWVLTRPGDIQMLPRAKQVIAIVFVIQTILTAITSAALALYTVHVAHNQAHIEDLLTQSHPGTRQSIKPAVPELLAQLAGWSNCGAMLAMAALWIYVGFMR
jgi:hypothetical protein